MAAKKDVWRIASPISPHRTALIAKAMNRAVAISLNPLSRNFVRFVFSFALGNVITNFSFGVARYGLRVVRCELCVGGYGFSV